MSSENVASRFCNHFSIIQGHHGCKMCSNFPGIKLEPALLRDKKAKLNICHHVLMSSSQLQNKSFHVVERTRTSAECPKMKTARANRANLLFFTVKYANFGRSCCRRRRGCVNSLMVILVHAECCFLCVLPRTCGRCIRKMDHHCPWFVLSMAILKYCYILIGLHNKVTVPSCE